MHNNYDFIVIGAGISACTFASFLNKKDSNVSILLIEQGRRIGGRATTRISRKNKMREFDHGLPSISLSEDTSQDILAMIDPLIKTKILVDISNDILTINQFGEMNKSLINVRTYKVFPFMINFCEEIINQAANPQKINFLFQTLVTSIRRANNLWEIEVNKERFIRSRNLILSSSLIAHPRCLKTLKIDSLPLNEAFTQGKDEIVDLVLKETRKQNYIKRRIYILHVSDPQAVKNFSQKYLQISFTNTIREDLNFERIIFQRQSDESIVVILHCYYFKSFSERNINSIMKYLSLIFKNHKIFLDLFLHARLIDKMDWRASQPLNNFIAKELQWSSASKIGFCGDWFDFDGCCRVESAMNSSISLAKLVN